MTPLEKAEAVLAAMRGHIVCTTGNHFVDPATIVWNGTGPSSEPVIRMCRDCWYTALEAHDRQEAKRNLEPLPECWKNMPLRP